MSFGQTLSEQGSSGTRRTQSAHAASIIGTSNPAAAATFEAAATITASDKKPSPPFSSFFIEDTRFRTLHDRDPRKYSSEHPVKFLFPESPAPSPASSPKKEKDGAANKKQNEQG